VRQADELEQQAKNRLQDLHRQISRLQDEVRRVEKLAGQPQVVSIRVKMIEFDRNRLGSAEGQALLARYGHRAAGTSELLSQSLSRLSQSREFLDETCREKFVKVLEDVTLVTHVGEPAAFLSGGEFPVPGPNGTSFRSFGVQLVARVTALGGRRVRMHITPELSQLDRSHAVQISGMIVPGLVSRRIQTELELTLGETAVIGGLVSRGETLPQAKVQPATHDEASTEEAELLFLITAEQVEDQPKPAK
jgi:Flp pilus assembly secretin CpaC